MSFLHTPLFITSIFLPVHGRSNLFSADGFALHLPSSYHRAGYGSTPPRSDECSETLLEQRLKE